MPPGASGDPQCVLFENQGTTPTLCVLVCDPQQVAACSDLPYAACRDIGKGNSGFCTWLDVSQSITPSSTSTPTGSISGAATRLPTVSVTASTTTSPTVSPTASPTSSQTMDSLTVSLSLSPSPMVTLPVSPSASVMQSRISADVLAGIIGASVAIFVLALWWWRKRAVSKRVPTFAGSGGVEINAIGVSKLNAPLLRAA